MELKETILPKICNLFVSKEQITGNDYRYYVWVFNTMIGDFAEYTFNYTYNGSNYVPVGHICGGQTAFVVNKNVDKGNKLEFLVYSALTNSFSLFDTPLYNWGHMSFHAGGLIIDGFDEQTYFLYDVQTQHSFSHSVRWPEGYVPIIRARGLSNYWCVFSYTTLDQDTAHVFSYSRLYNNLYAFDIVGRASASFYNGEDFYGLLLTDGNAITKAFLYSPLSSNWTEINYASSTYQGSEGNYFYLDNTDINKTYFYDAQTNQEFWFPLAQQDSYVLAHENVSLMYSGEGEYVGYSMVSHSSKEYIVNRYPSQQWDNFIVLNINGNEGNQFEYLLYDAYNNIFAPLTLTEEQGTKMLSWPGGKTALIATQKGYLYAYNPGDVTSVDDNQNRLSRFSNMLYQNHPNPFKTHTKIKYTISPFDLLQPKSEIPVSLKVYNFLGKEVATLVDELKSIGDYEIEFNGEGLSSGIYFYTLKAGNLVITQKMVLIKE